MDFSRLDHLGFPQIMRCSHEAPVAACWLETQTGEREGRLLDLGTESPDPPASPQSVKKRVGVVESPLGW